MKYALSLCSLLVLAASGCDPSVPLFELAEHPEARPSAKSDGGTETSEDLCAVYCGAYEAQCGDGSFPYASYDECETLCPYWEYDGEDNVAAKCRLEALGDPHFATQAARCDAAGPDSSACGTAYVVTCERYCDLYEESCGGHGMQFESGQKCLSWCEGETLDGPTGDTIECRLGWLTSPAAPPQCSAATPDSDACE